MVKERNSNYDLLKIISMLMIVMWHILCHGKLLENSQGSLKVLFYFLGAILTVHVNCFVLITGYFQCKNNFKLNKILFLNNKAWFYRVIIILLFIILGNQIVGKLEFLYNIFPLPLINEDAWFFKVYLILYILSPFLNKLINSFNKNDFRKFLFVYGFIFSFLTTVTNQLFFYNKDGYSIQNFIFLYFIGAYLRNYPLENSFKLAHKSISQKRVIYLLVFIICAVTNFMIYVFGVKVGNFSVTASTFFTSRIFAYDNPLVIIGAISLFQLFGTFNFKNKYINDIAGLTFGIYLIHDNYLVRNFLYDCIGIKLIDNGFYLIIAVVCFTFIIFLVSMAIDYFVNILFNKLSKLKLFLSIKEKLYNIFDYIKKIVIDY